MLAAMLANPLAPIWAAIVGAEYVWVAVTTLGTTAMMYGFMQSTKNDVVDVTSDLITNSQQSATQNTEQENPDLEEKLDKAGSWLVYGATALVLLVGYKYAKKLLKF
jgi:ABC-type lipoprotein release transport system permease subunit